MKDGAIQEQLQRQGSPLHKYRQAVSGRQGFASFLYYELVTILVSPLPGRVGIRLRRIALPPLFAGFGSWVTVRQNVSFRRPKQIRLGRNVTIDAGVILDVKNEAGSIEIQDNVHIGCNTILSCPGGELVIGAGTLIGSRCRLGSLMGLSVGRGCVIDNQACLVGAGHAFDSLEIPIIRQQSTCRGKTTLHDGVRVGRRATVLDGLELGENAVVAPGSLVNRDIPAGCHAGGVPVVVAA